MYKNTSVKTYIKLTSASYKILLAGYLTMSLQFIQILMIDKKLLKSCDTVKMIITCVQVDYSISQQHADKKVFSDINLTVTQKQFKLKQCPRVILLRRNVKKLLESILIRRKTILYVRSKSWRKRLTSKLSRSREQPLTATYYSGNVTALLEL